MSLRYAVYALFFLSLAQGLNACARLLHYDAATHTVWIGAPR